MADDTDLLSLLDNNDLSLHKFGAPDREFLRAVDEEGGARTQDIRGYGLDRQQIHYRYDSLEERGLIQVDRVGLEDHDGRKQNVATLTDLGEQLVEAGLLGRVTDANTNLEEIGQRVDQLKQKHNRDHQKVLRKLNLLEDQSDAIKELNQANYDLWEYVNELQDRIEELEAKVEGDS